MIASSTSARKNSTCVSFTIPDSRPFFEREQSQSNLPRKLSNSSYEQVVQQLRSLRLVVVGCARDVEANLNGYRNHIEQIIELFHPSSRILIFESDSTDKTVSKLNNWARAEIFSQGVLVKQYASRTDRLALCRNTLLTRAYNYVPDFILVTDVDMFSTSVASFLSNFYYNTDDWSVMTASVTGGYYDIWALRTLSDDVMNYDVWHRIWQLERAREKYCNHNFIELIILTHKKQIPIERDLIEVRSAFGGAGLYKVNSTYGCKYNGSGATCEHVPFHLCMREKNRARIFINPRFLLR
ncbi:unnamed protein product [Adineta ricciae]|uniref:Uncharacterized protein n=1 Tax=Adineta ricciae TaxID=249248 RepID=A0A815KA82_ADIRI|nr:unnamed protein product [Adineta ricciae]CAF1441711.1 unnamed protein product [Adineta ricciae]